MTTPRPAASRWRSPFLLLTACLLVSGAQAAWMLCIGFYFLRLGGQGLMVHTALTATARQFPLMQARRSAPSRWGSRWRRPFFL
ncbi:hypothetical protein LNO02_28435 [Klebsiella variicola subsp. variicola]|nr:hypothetical protein [Klebsiella variicola subsp. variicola]